MKLHEYLKIKRIEKNISQYKVAKDLNIAIRNVQRWEEGTSLPNAKYIFKLIDYLELDQEQVKKILYEQD